MCLHCEVGVRPRIRINYFSDYYGLSNLPDTTLIVTSRGLCTIKNSKNYVSFYTVNIDVLVILIMQANMNFTSVYGEVLQQCLCAIEYLTISARDAMIFAILEEMRADKATIKATLSTEQPPPTAGN